MSTKKEGKVEDVSEPETKVEPKEDLNPRIVSDSINKDGQMVIEVAGFVDNLEKYNGKYVFDYPQMRHRSVVFSAMSDMKSTGSWAKVAQTIAAKRGVQVKEVVRIVEDGGLSEDETKMFSDIAENNVDIVKMYKYASEILLAFVIECPKGLTLKSLDDYEHLHMKVGQLLYLKCLNWSFSGMGLAEERRKK